jgi:tetratricopeptide (TPR) repeat protein
MEKMSPETWTRLEPLLDEALDLEPARRAEWLREFRVRDPATADAVARLLDAGELSESILEGLHPADLPARGLAGHTVGSYTLHRLIGQGGMGSVWLAERSDGRYQGRVAVKLLNLAVAGRAGEERFRQEGTLLARLSHPNIARLIDAGVTAAGQPFLALEYVDGTPIDQYADERRLPPEARIRLMIEVLEAVSAAHANLIVHRDIKPSNILVTANGQVKLLDFGIAKLLAEGRVAEASTLTEDGARAMTPRFAAPEQVLGESVSTATDVYSAAVLLFMLLSDRHPTQDVHHSEPAALAAIAERDPPRLSAAVLMATDEGPEVRAVRRSSTPKRLSRLYRGDLDNILAKALRKRPADRYPTAAAFADDLRRVLRHEPVAAGPEGLGYRAAKFARRHRAGVVATVLATLSLVGGLGAALHQMVAARQERDRAEAAGKRADASVAFESLLFRLLEPGGPALTYDQLLERGRRVLEREFRGEPEARMQLGNQFAQHYLRGREPATAREILARNVVIADSAGDREWQARARCALGEPLTLMAQSDSALALVAAGRRYLAQVASPERGTLNDCDFVEAQARLATGEADAAVALLAGIARRFERAGDTTTSDYRNALNDVAGALTRAERYREALDIFRRLARSAHEGSASGPETLSIFIYNATAIYDVLGEYRGARDFLAAEIRAAERDDAGSLQPMTYYDYATMLDRVGEADSALAWFARALADPQIDSARIFGARLASSRLANGLGQPALAAQHRAAAMRVPERLLSPGPRAALAIERIRTAAHTGASPAAMTTISRELAALGYRPEGKTRSWTGVLAEAVRTLLEHGRVEEARPYLEHLLALGRRDSLAAGRSAIVGSALLLGARAAVVEGDASKARDLAERAAAPLAFGLGDGHHDTRAARALRDSLSGS